MEIFSSPSCLYCIYPLVPMWHSSLVSVSGRKSGLRWKQQLIDLKNFRVLLLLNLLSKQLSVITQVFYGWVCDRLIIKEVSVGIIYKPKFRLTRVSIASYSSAQNVVTISFHHSNVYSNLWYTNSECLALIFFPTPLNNQYQFITNSLLVCASYTARVYEICFPKLSFSLVIFSSFFTHST